MKSHAYFSAIRILISLFSLLNQVGRITGLDYRTTGLTQTAKYTLFSVEQKLNILIHSVTSLSLLPTISFLEFLEVKGQLHI